MKTLLLAVALSVCVCFLQTHGVAGDELPTLYEYFAEGKIVQGLSNIDNQFTLNLKNITIVSGTIHYFRVHPDQWRDRLRKMRAAGLNAIETYVPWNLHEPQMGVYDFGDGDNEFSPFLNVTRFLEIVQEEDLLAIVRPGPYICGEWEYGGLPSWLLREPGIRMRTSDEVFEKHVERYFNVLLKILAKKQFTTMGGPIIMMQIENEYGNTKNDDKPYLEFIKSLFLKNGIVELLFTSDTQSVSKDLGALPGVLQTSNYPYFPSFQFNLLKKLQPGKPAMGMEFWTGWFDHWSEQHQTRTADSFGMNLEMTLKYPASVNMYMFIGGTDFGFMNGANYNLKGPFDTTQSAVDNEFYQPDTTSYDYDAPLTENGDYGEKYFVVKKVLEQYKKIDLRTPEMPEVTPLKAYEPVGVQQRLDYETMVAQIPDAAVVDHPIAMELFPDINNNSGQSYGHIIYSKAGVDIPANSVLKIEGRVCDSVIVLVNGKLKSKVLETSEDLNGFGYWRMNDSTLDLGNEELSNATIELIVENWGRVNFGLIDQFMQFKGIWQGDILLNDQPLTPLTIRPLELKSKWVQALTGWQEYKTASEPSPSLYKATFILTEAPSDTYLDMSDWVKGNVYVNGFNIGRYCRIGPQQSLYIPAPLLKEGNNEIIVFEQFKAPNTLKFADKLIFETR